VSDTPGQKSRPNHGGTPRERVVRFARQRWLAIVLVVLIVIFIAQNRQRVSINFLWLHLRSPLWFILAITAIVGLAIGVSVARRQARSKRRQPPPPAADA
jgi:uncharacterized integral membrane protein